jgi:NADPH:quinone reductase-like Zn-dependent oxidoreductase
MKMRALQILSQNQPLKYQIINLIKPKITHGKSVIKVLYSPINPSDFGFIAGVYGREKFERFPKPLGFEGSGIIIDSENKNLMGKKVSFCLNYTNSE